jgi:hypothetical protein
VITLAPSNDASGVPPVIRLRRALKALLRAYGLRCVSARIGGVEEKPELE